MRMDLSLLFDLGRQPNLEGFWASRSLSLVLKDQNPFRVNNSINTIKIRPMQNTLLHVDVFYTLNRLRQPNKYFPIESSLAFATFKSYSVEYRSLAIKPANRAIVQVRFQLAFDVKVERQVYTELMTLFAGECTVNE